MYLHGTYLLSSTYDAEQHGVRPSRERKIAEGDERSARCNFCKRLCSSEVVTWMRLVNTYEVCGT